MCCTNEASSSGEKAVCLPTDFECLLESFDLIVERFIPNVAAAVL